jgi:NitT/TauT family transport system permease protein
VRDRTSETAVPNAAVAEIRGSERSWSRLLLPATAGALVVLSWWVVVALFAIPQYIVPAPGAVFASMVENRAELLTNAWATGRIAALGLLLSVLLGVPTGLIVARYRLARRLLMPPIVAIQSLPKVALAPLFVAWLGFGVAPKLIITVLVTFFPMTLATIVGVESITRSTAYLARSMGCRSFAFLRLIQLPAAAPFIAAAFRTSATLAVVGALVAEFVGSIDGLGNLLLIASGNRDTTLAFGAILTVGLLGVVFYVGAAALVRVATMGLGTRYMGSVTT